MPARAKFALFCTSQPVEPRTLWSYTTSWACPALPAAAVLAAALNGGPRLDLTGKGHVAGESPRLGQRVKFDIPLGVELPVAEWPVRRKLAVTTPGDELHVLPAFRGWQQRHRVPAAKGSRWMECRLYVRRRCSIGSITHLRCGTRGRRRPSARCRPRCTRGGRGRMSRIEQ